MTRVQTSDPPSKASTCEKLLRRIFCASCLRGEAENAALKLVAVVKAHGISYEDLRAQLAPPPPVREIQADDDDDEPAACEIILTFGKHRGETLGEVARRDARYLRWLIDELVTRPEIVAAAEVVAEHFGLLEEDDE